MLITHTGLSGPVILDNSGKILTDDILKADFANEKESLNDFKDNLRKQGKKNLKKYLKKYLFHRDCQKKLLIFQGLNLKKIVQI